MTHIIQARNVNDAFVKATILMTKDEGFLRRRQPAGKALTVEHIGPVVTEYIMPLERVLFNPVRDVNPFFHLMEALWILAGRDDVGWLARFNKQMAAYSDDGKVFHAPYGWRLRKMGGVDQLHEAALVLQKDIHSRQAVMQIWNYGLDLGTISKDIPCNDLLFAKVNDGCLDLTVCCRSNDIIWGCYGTNVVQFSMIQERLAAQIGLQVGTLRQISDSFHYYPENEATKRVLSEGSEVNYDLYSDMTVGPMPLVFGASSIDDWEKELLAFMTTTSAYHEDTEVTYPVDTPDMFFKQPFFRYVAYPMYRAWAAFKGDSAQHAANMLLTSDQYVRGEFGISNDWLYAGRAWMLRRAAKKEVGHGG